MKFPVFLAFLSFATATAQAAPPLRIAADALDGTSLAAPSGRGWKSPWQTSRLLAPLAEDDRPGLLLRGTGERNNPLRCELAEPYREAELFVRFRLLYEPPEDTGEFFVLWLDRLDGGDTATHSDAAPNIGLHVAVAGAKKGKTVFMVRIGSAKTAFSAVELEHGREYLLVGRLSKSDPSDRTDYDRFELWVDPAAAGHGTPDAAITSPNSINFVRWVGFATGRKTEPEDGIRVRDLVLSRTWDDALGSDGASSPTTGTPAKTTPGTPWPGKVDFARDVHPLLKSRCFECHSGERPESGLRLDARNEILGYSSGEAVAEPGKAAKSKIIEKIAASNPEDRMPPAESGHSPLNDREIGLLHAWIEQGLAWDETLLPSPRITSDHWSFQPVRRPEVPAVKNGDRVRTPIDAFLFAARENAGVRPASEASPTTLVRRLHLDLTGLPPSPEAVAAFEKEAADSPEAYDHLVDRLLASPHYGERWGRHWLDLARWAESQGYQHDIPRPYAWRYRDYVIESFNRDKPYDRFLTEQIAGDELKPYSDENLVATGFLAAARISGNNEDPAAQRNDVLLDIVNATGSAVLGLTMECAQCHNHKFDPISQRDYYRLQAFFVKGQLGNLALRDPSTPNPTDLENWMSKGAYDFYMTEAKKRIDKKAFTHTTVPHTWGYLAPGTADPGIERLPVVNRVPIEWNPADLAQTRGRILVRGDVHRPGPEVEPGWPEVLGPTPATGTEMTRRDLAAWLASPENPLVARVWANRIWQWHFGRGLVTTSGDFGLLGSPPSHPELLDWLATELRENGWSTKHLHRLIVLSAAYRQERRHDPDNATIDPDNVLLWSFPRRRLEAEAIRDSALAVSGELDLSTGGPGVPPQREESALRRTLYLSQRRSEMPDAMTLFDSPEPVASCQRREVSTVALQPLYLLNSEFMLRRAEAFAGRVAREAGSDPRDRVATAFRLALARAPEPDETTKALVFLDAGEDRDSLVHFCHALLNLNEFIYLP
jgi:hypothetical protein